MQFTDQLHRKVQIEHYPNRIISLVPSLTELLVDLGMGKKIVGLTKFCIHPKGFKNEKTIVGGTKNFRLEVVDSLNPDLIIGNKEENYLEGIEALAEKYPVWMSDVNDLEEACEMILEIGRITNTTLQTENFLKEIQLSFDREIPKKGTAVYLIWNDPIMVAGGGTFINQMLQKAGFKNLITTLRYPKIKIEDLKFLNPDFLLLSSEPFPFTEKHLGEYQAALPNSKIRIVDGEMFSWYGSRLLKSSAYFHSLS